MKASELIQKLQRSINEFGDKEVYVRNFGYPGKAINVSLQKSDRCVHIPKDSCVIQGSEFQ